MLCVVSRCYPLSNNKIDAVRVGQGNDLENNSQLGLMRELYWKAGRVLVWLGDLSEDARMVMLMIPFMLENRANILQKLSEEAESSN